MRWTNEETYFDQNHFKSWFENGSEEPSFESVVHYISTGKLLEFPASPIDEAVKAAHIISQKLKDPVLCLSGGLDSEAMAIAFLKAKVSFRVAVMKFDNNLNDYDHKFAYEFSEKYNIPISEVTLPALEILESGKHLEFANKYQTMSPERALFLMFLDKLEGNPVLAGEILRFEKKNDSIQLACPKYRDLCYWRYFQQTNRLGVPYFHYYTPQLTYSFMAHTDLSNREIIKTDWTGQHKEFYRHKFKIYKQAGFEVVDFPERSQKWHGYEGVKIFYDSIHGSNEAYNNKFRKPLEKFPVYDQNQMFIVSDEDTLAHRILENRTAPVGHA